MERESSEQLDDGHGKLPIRLTQGRASNLAIIAHANGKLPIKHLAGRDVLRETSTPNK
jgi:hypothetical protein